MLITSSAAISSATVIVPICAAMADPTLAAMTRPVMKGPISRSIEMHTSVPMLFSCP